MSSQDHKTYSTIAVLAALGLMPLNAQSADTVTAEDRGAQILELQMQRAQRLNELEYQAEVLERQARIAKAQEQIDKTVGLELTPVAPAPVMSDSDQMVSYAPKPVIETPFVTPKILELGRTKVKFAFDNGATGVYRVGDTLASGYQVMAISMVDGVQLQRGSSVVNVGYQW